MKKITAILLGMALVCFVAVGVYAANRTVEKQHFKTMFLGETIDESLNYINPDFTFTGVSAAANINMEIPSLPEQVAVLKLSREKKHYILLSFGVNDKRYIEIKNRYGYRYIKYSPRFVWLNPDISYSKLRLKSNWRPGLNRTC